VVHDTSKDRYYALTTHEFGRIFLDGGRFAEIEVDPSVGDFGWPKGLAFDSSRGQVVIATSHVFTRFYRYGPDDSRWERMSPEIRDFPLVALTYSPDEDCLYALTRRSGDRALREIYRFNATGASLGSIKLDPPVPVPDETGDPFQLHFSSGKLILVLPPLPVDVARAAGIQRPTEDKRIVAVDPAAGEVAVAESALPALLVEEGEGPIEAVDASGGEGTGSEAVDRDRPAPTVFASLRVD
jgi:hypothetical protein